MTGPEIICLARDSDAARSALYRGTFEQGGHLYRALPREVVDVPGGPESLVFELRDERDVGAPGPIATWLRAARAVSLTASLTPCLAVLLLGLGRSWTPRPALASLAMLGAALLQVSVNLLNDVEDHVRLFDLPGTLGGTGVLQRGWVSAVTMRRVGLAALGAGSLAGLPAVVSEPRILLLLGLVAVLGVLGYSGRPFELKYRALGDLAIFALCGPCLTVGFSFAAFGQTDAGVALLGVFFGLAAEAIVHSNNLQDIDGDTGRGARTLASVLGFPAARRVLPLVYTAGGCVLGAGVAARALPPFALAPLLVAPLLVRLSSRSLRASGPTSALLARLRVHTARAHLWLGLLLCLGLGLSRLAR